MAISFVRYVPSQIAGGGSALPIDSLIALAALRGLKRRTTEELAIHIQREPAQAKRTLEALVETGLAQAHGTTRGRTRTLAAGVYPAEGGKAAYTRQMGFSNLQHEQLELSYVRQHGAIRRAEVIELCRLSEGQAKDLLKRMRTKELLSLEEAGRTAAYWLSAPSYELRLNGCKRMVLDIAILNNINKINDLLIELDIYARGPG